VGAADASIPVTGHTQDRDTTNRVGKFDQIARSTLLNDRHIGPHIESFSGPTPQKLAKNDAEDSFARHTAKLIPQLDIVKVTKKFHQELKGLLDDRGTKVSPADFDIYKTAFLQRYVKLIGDKIITMEDLTVLEFIYMLEDLKKEYSIKFGIPVGTDPNNPETISVALEGFDTIVKKVFDSVKDDESLQTEITRFRDFLDENKNVLSNIPTRDVTIKKVIGDNYKATSNPYRIELNNIMLGFVYLSQLLT
jgi:hypothetical protein